MYNFYDDGVHLLLILDRGAFLKDIIERFILHKSCDNSQEYVIK